MADPVTHVVFDLDDTLYPERDYAIGGFRAAARWILAEHGADVDVARMVALLDEGALGKLFPTVLAEAMPDHDASVLKGFLAAYRDSRPTLTLFADAAAALDYWQPRAKLGLITDGHAVTQNTKIDVLALRPRFQCVITTGALGPDRAFHKPHPRAFEMTMSALGRPGDRFVYVGDNISKDFVAPNALGWTTILIDRPHHRNHRIHKHERPAAGGAPHYVIHDLAELATLIV